MALDTLRQRVRDAVRDVPDFPKAGILFKDITPVLADAQLFTDVTVAMAAPFVDADITHVVAIESRGFIFGAPIAQRLGAAFVPVRKPGKLPWEVRRETYALEYGTDALDVHVDAFGGAARVLVVDDVLATGGTAAAACRLVEQLDVTVAGVSVLIELGFLDGRRPLAGHVVHALIAY